MTYQKNDYAIHPDLGLCRVVSIHTVHEPDGETVAYQACDIEKLDDGSTVRVPVKHLTPADRLTLQSWGLLGKVTYQDWCVDVAGEIGPSGKLRRVCNTFHEKDGLHIYLSNHRGGYRCREARLATPLELLRHGIIDELPSLRPSDCCGAHTRGVFSPAECLLCGGEVDDTTDHPTGLSGLAAREAMSDEMRNAFDLAKKMPCGDPLASGRQAHQHVEYLTDCCGAKATLDGSLFVCGECGSDGPETGIYKVIAGCVDCGSDIKIGLFGHSGSFRCESCRDPQPRDANGEVLGVGDVIRPASSAGWPKDPAIVSELHENGVVVSSSGLEGFGSNWEKLHTLTPTQYLPLARRTLDPDMTRKERLSMLAMGAVGEWGEWQERKTVDELGDVLWYLTLLCEELDAVAYGAATGFPEGAPLVEWFKKYIYHDTHEDQVKSAVWRWLCFAEDCAEVVGLSAGQVRYANIRKLLDRYPEGFELGGGQRDDDFTDLITTGYAPMHDETLRDAVEAGAVRVVHCAMAEDGESPVVFVREVEG